MLLSVVIQDTENHAYPTAYYVLGKENDASWTFFFNKFHEIMVDEPNCVLSLINTRILPTVMSKFKIMLTADIV